MPRHPLCTLIRFPYYRTESPALLARAYRYYLRVDYSTVKTHSPFHRRFPGPQTLRCVPDPLIRNQRSLSLMLTSCGDKGTRTLDLGSAIAALSQLSYIPFRGDKGTRTPDLLGASEALSQLSYVPVPWGWQDSNLRPHAYQACALTN